MRRVLFLFLMSVSLAAAANPFPKGDPKTGKQIHDKSCVSCHKRMYGGDGSEMYTRLERRLNSAAALREQVAVCNAQTNAGLFPEEEENVAAYLNDKYYKFK